VAKTTNYFYYVMSVARATLLWLSVALIINFIDCNVQYCIYVESGGICFFVGNHSNITLYFKNCEEKRVSIQFHSDRNIPRKAKAIFRPVTGN
jgi:hypothetical protein